MSVTQPPPNARPEVRTSQPTRNHAWVPGDYEWRNNQWEWRSGQWAVPPRSGATWVPGRYDTATKQWTGGYWSSEATPSESR